MRVNLDDLSWPVITERLVLRRPTEADVDAVYAYRSLPESSEWTSRSAGTGEEFHQHFVNVSIKTMVVVEHDGAIVGDLMVRVEDAWAQAEVADQAKAMQADLGWSFDPAHHGQGFATEAVRAAIDLCFAPHGEGLGLRRVYAECFSDNAPSWRLMERIGMRRESHAVAESLHRSGRWLDGYTYALLRSEWPRPAAS